MKKSLLIILQIIILLLYQILEICNFDIEVYKILFTIIYLECLLLSFIGKFLNIYQIFLISLFFFNFSRIFIDIFFHIDMEIMDLWMKGRLSEESTKELLKYFSVFCLSTSIGFISNLESNKVNISKKRQLVKVKNNKLYIIVFIIFLLVSLANNLALINLTLKNGYISLYNKNIYEIVLLKGGATISIVIYLYLINKLKDKKQFIILTVLILLFLWIPRMLIGQRGPTLVFIVYIIYLYNRRYQIKNKLSIGIYGILIILSAKIIELFRENQKIEKDIFYSFVSIFYSQGISMLVPAYLLEYKKELIYNHKYPYIFSYFLDLFKDLGNHQNINHIINGNYLGHQLTYFISKNIFFNGNGTGTSIIAELIDLSSMNLLLFILFSFFMMKFIYIIEKAQDKNIYYYVISYIFIQNFIYSPRDSIFKNLNMLINLLVGVFLLNLLKKLLTRRKRDEKNFSS